MTPADRARLDQLANTPLDELTTDDLRWLMDLAKERRVPPSTIFLARTIDLRETVDDAWCTFCGRAIHSSEGSWSAVKGVERGYPAEACEASEDGTHAPQEVRA